MGVITILERHITVDGSRWLVYASTTTDDMMRASTDGVASLLLKKEGDPDWTHGCWLPVSGDMDGFFARFFRAFRALEGFRESCRLDASGDSPICLGKKTSAGFPIVPALPAPTLDADVTRLNKMGEKAKFKHFLHLKSGRDRFSSMKAAALLGLLEPEDLMAMDRAISNRDIGWEEEQRTKCLRWIARGLFPELAVRKVLVDQEVSQKVTRR